MAAYCGDNTYKTHIHQLEVLQRKAIRAITNSKYNTSSSQLFKKTKILKLGDIYNTQINMFMYDYTTSNVPTSLSQLFTSNNSIHSHQTRHQNDMHISHRHSETVARSFICQCPATWLNLPIDIKNSRSHNAFKYKIKQHYIKDY